MRRGIVAGLALALLALGGCRSGGEEAGKPIGADEPSEGQPALQTVGGIVTGAQANRVDMVDGNGNRVSLQLGEDVQIMQDENPVGREKLEAGASVRASYRDRNGQLVATRIDIDSPAGSPPSPSVQPGRQGMDDGQPAE